MEKGEENKREKIFTFRIQNRQKDSSSTEIDLGIIRHDIEGIIRHDIGQSIDNSF